MNTIELEPSVLEPAVSLAKTKAVEKPFSILKRFEEFAESQKDKRLAWFMISLLAQSVLVLPVPAALMYYFNAPIWVLAITVSLFFANIVAGMSGSKISVLMALIAITTVVHIAMIMTFVL